MTLLTDLRSQLNILRIQETKAKEKYEECRFKRLSLETAINVLTDRDDNIDK